MATQRNDQLFTSASEEHYTPADIIERARYVFGGTIDLDPAANYDANQTVKAARYYADPHTSDPLTRSDARCAGYDGLVQSWVSSALWLNPPFSVPARDDTGAYLLNTHGKVIRSRVIDSWVSRWVLATTPQTYGYTDSARSAEASEAMLLIPARTDTQWFTALWSSRYTLAFMFGRLKFSKAENGATFPSILVYHGTHTDRFYDVFGEIAACGKLLRKTY